MTHQIIDQAIDNECTFHQHLVELLSDDSIVCCKALVAFITLRGLMKISDTLKNFVDTENKQLHWIVGIDFITTPDSLILLRELVSGIPRHSIRAFESPAGRLFHPKVYMFYRENGTGSILVGSNNLTPGGLIENYEVSVRLNNLTAEEMQQWNNLWVRVNQKEEYLKEITDPLIETVRESRRREQQGRPRQRPVTLVTAETEVTEITPIILIREVPRAGGRTSQVHFTRNIVEDYFHFRIGETRNVKFQQVQTGTVGPIEVRPLVYSERNMNPKIELTGARILSENYPTDGSRPIILFEQVKEDFFRYMLILLGNKGFVQLTNYLAGIPRHGLALKYSFVSPEDMLRIWPEFPM